MLDIAAVADITADEIRLFAEAGPRRSRAIRAVLDVRDDIMDLVRRGDGVVPIDELQRQ